MPNVNHVITKRRAIWPGVHPKIGNVTAEQIKGYVNTYNEMAAAGRYIPFTFDHPSPTTPGFLPLRRVKSLPKPEAVRGMVKAARQAADGSMDVDISIPAGDDEARRVAENNQVSLGILDKWEADGRTWANPVIHVAATPYPIIANQIVPLLMSYSSAVLLGDDDPEKKKKPDFAKDDGEANSEGGGDDESEVPKEAKDGSTDKQTVFNQFIEFGKILGLPFSDDITVLNLLPSLKKLVDDLMGDGEDDPKEEEPQMATAMLSHADALKRLTAYENEKKADAKRRLSERAVALKKSAPWAASAVDPIIAELNAVELSVDAEGKVDTGEIGKRLDFAEKLIAESAKVRMTAAETQLENVVELSHEGAADKKDLANASDEEILGQALTGLGIRPRFSRVAYKNGK